MSSNKSKFVPFVLTSEDYEWTNRESARIARGEYREVPWAYERFVYAARCNHYAHASVEEPGMVAFTESVEKGRRDIQTRMKPGRYLSRYFGDVLTAAAIKMWAEDFAGHFGVAELKIADTPDEIERVYLKGPNSCMSHSRGEYSSDQHPVRVYGAGDLAVAYIEAVPGRVTARAIVWPARKVSSRIYGDESRLAPLLTAAGYAPGGSRAFQGARLLRIPQDGGYFICPYLDLDNHVDDDGEHLVVGGDIGARETNGLTESRGRHCENCERNFSDEAYHVDGNTWCESCYEEYAGTCEHCGRSGHLESMCRAVDGDGNDVIVCDRCLRRNYSQCERCETWRPRRIMEGALCNDCVIADGESPERPADPCPETLPLPLSPSTPESPFNVEYGAGPDGDLINRVFRSSAARDYATCDRPYCVSVNGAGRPPAPPVLEESPACGCDLCRERGGNSAERNDRIAAAMHRRVGANRPVATCECPWCRAHFE